MTTRNEFSSLITLFDKAANKLKYPKVTLEFGPFQLQLKRAGIMSRYPGSISIVVDREWIGRITRLGALELYDMRIEDANFRLPVLNQNFKLPTLEYIKNTITETIINFQQDPAEYARIYGQKYNTCCFCYRELTNKHSVFRGYGPICAVNFGLPWTMETGDEFANMLDEVLNDDVKI